MLMMKCSSIFCFLSFQQGTKAKVSDSAHYGVTRKLTERKKERFDRKLTAMAHKRARAHMHMQLCMHAHTQGGL